MNHIRISHPKWSGYIQYYKEDASYTDDGELEYLEGCYESAISDRCYWANLLLEFGVPYELRLFTTEGFEVRRIEL